MVKLAQSGVVEFGVRAHVRAGADLDPAVGPVGVSGAELPSTPGSSSRYTRALPVSSGFLRAASSR